MGSGEPVSDLPHMTAGLGGEGTSGAGGPIKTLRRLCRRSYRVGMVCGGISIGDVSGSGFGGLSSQEDTGATGRMYRASGDCNNADVVAVGALFEDADDGERKVLTS